MWNCRRLFVVVLMCMFGLSTAVAHAGSSAAPVTQISPSPAGPVTFANTAVEGGTTTLSVQLLLNQSGTLTISVPASANSHQEFAVGTVSGCAVDGTTVNTASSICTVPVTFQPYYPGQRSQPLVVTLDGQVYSFGLTGLGTGPLAHIDTTNLTTIAGAAGTTSSTAYTYKTGVPLGSGAILYEPEGIFTDSSNNIYVTDAGHNLVRVAYQAVTAQLACLIITENPTDFGLSAGSNTCAGATSQPVANTLYTIAGTTTAAYNSDNVLATTANLSAPAGVEVDAAGNVFIGDQGNSRVRVIYQGGSTIACLIQIENPTTFGLAAGATSCAGATSQPTPGFIYTIAGTGTSGYSGDGGLATAAKLDTPNDVAVDSAGDVFMVNFSAANPITIPGRIRVIYNGGTTAAQLIEVENPTVTAPVVGDIYTVAGSALTDGGDGSLATSSNVGMLTLYSLRIDAYDNIYIADKTYSASSYGNPANQARIRAVYNGTVAAPNSLANLISLENPTTVPTAASVQPGYIYTIAGETGTATQSAPTVDGVLATAQQFAGIYGLSLDPAGDIIVADRLNYTIRRISFATGIISTIGGFPTSASSGTFVTSGSAQSSPGGVVTPGIGQMFGPWSISIDSAGGVYFSDYGGNRLRYLSSAPSSTYPLILPATAVGSTSTIVPLIETNIGTPGSTLTLTANKFNTPFGFLSPAGFPGISECATTSTTTLSSSTITTSVNLAAGVSCSFGIAAQPLNGGVTTGTGTTTDNSGNSVGTHTLNASVTGTGVTTVLTTNPSPITGGNPTQLIATLTTAASAPVTCGTVAFSITGGASLGTATLDPTLGTATITTSLLAAPTTSITTVYAGSTSGASCSNAAFTPSTSTTVLTVSAKPATTLVITTNNTAPNLNQSIAITATVSSGVSAGAFTGTVTFTDTLNSITSTIGTQAVNSSGVTVLNIATLAAGTHTIKASYAGDLVYANASSTASLTIVVTAPSYTVTLTSPSGIAIVSGQSGVADFSIATTGGYTGTISVSCGNSLPVHVGCVYTPASYVFAGLDNTLTGQVTITTQATIASNTSRPSTTLLAFLLPGAVLTFFGLRRRKLRAWQGSTLLLLCGLMLAASLCGCGKPATNDAVYGTFNVPVTFTDGTTTQVEYVTVTATGH